MGSHSQNTSPFSYCYAARGCFETSCSQTTHSPSPPSPYHQAIASQPRERCSHELGHGGPFAPKRGIISFYVLFYCFYFLTLISICRFFIAIVCRFSNLGLFCRFGGRTLTHCVQRGSQGMPLFYFSVISY